MSSVRDFLILVGGGSGVGKGQGREIGAGWGGVGWG